MGKYDRLKRIILFIHQLPQILLSRLIVSNNDVMIHKVDGVRIYHTTRMEGISLGDTIFISGDVYEGTWLVKHEFGHVIQSRILGWLYLPLIFVPSLLWYQLMNFIERVFCLNDEESAEMYYQFYTEYTANRLVSDLRKKNIKKV